MTKTVIPATRTAGSVRLAVYGHDGHVVITAELHPWTHSAVWFAKLCLPHCSGSGLRGLGKHANFLIRSTGNAVPWRLKVLRQKPSEGYGNEGISGRYPIGLRLKPGRGESMFISRQREKLLNAIVFFTKNTKRCYKLKLFKLLHFLDFEHYRQTGLPSIGLLYQAWPKGPVPPELDREIAHPALDLQSAVRISTRRDRMTNSPVRYVFTPKASFNPEHFSKRELRIMRELAMYFNDFDADDMSEFSHLKDLPWRTVYRGGAGNGQDIPYELALKSAKLTEGETIDADELSYRRDALEGIMDMI
jgi:uncharacterized phage-associated protein